ncbi:MAG TPA: STAS domain-containing protein [Burkholderiaceae bacterium]|nr:STAS domain-containing protein [Burkholderiaceae bacterium]HMX09365.1 STAS domain-containing protein [Burkholderiaceae bacterium]HMZ00313.1 STAS domain-containing protein [Burkholderiaceae bacterium]HNB44439.1 STAS domain-containing protein [Burkholderiaceae bacterium]HNG80041.1 STAS domain-containing protein [Burkholderiaceae bacterium]
MNQTHPARPEQAAADNPTPHSLPAELTIYHVSACAEQALRWLADQDASEPGAATMRLRGDAVEDIDSAGVQLLLSLARSLDRRGQRLELQAPSPALREALACLDATDLLADEQEATA